MCLFFLYSQLPEFSSFLKFDKSQLQLIRSCYKNLTWALAQFGSTDASASRGSTVEWKILENGKILEVNKIHVLVYKNLTKMEFRRTTSKMGLDT